MANTEKSAHAESATEATAKRDGFAAHHFSLFEKANICGALRSTIGLNAHNPGISEIWVHTSGRFAGLVEVTSEVGSELVPLSTICAIKTLESYEKEKARKEAGL